MNGSPWSTYLFLESMSGSLNVSKQVYSFVSVSFLMASSISQSHMFVFVLLLFYLLLTFLNLQAQIANIFFFRIDIFPTVPAFVFHGLSPAGGSALP